MGGAIQSLERLLMWIAFSPMSLIAAMTNALAWQTCRYYNSTAVQVILKMAAANGFARVWVGQHGERLRHAARRSVKKCCCASVSCAIL